MTNKKNNLIYNITAKQEKFHFGNQISYEWRHDAKHFMFSLSRYKFVSKMLEGYDSVLEIGAGDGFKSRIVSQSVKNLTLSDYTNVNYQNYNITEDKKEKYIVHNFLEKKLKKNTKAFTY